MYDDSHATCPLAIEFRSHWIVGTSSDETPLLKTQLHIYQMFSTEPPQNTQDCHPQSKFQEIALAFLEKKKKANSPISYWLVEDAVRQILLKNRQEERFVNCVITEGKSRDLTNIKHGLLQQKDIVSVIPTRTKSSCNLPKGSMRYQHINWRKWKNGHEGRDERRICYWNYLAISSNGAGPR